MILFAVLRYKTGWDYAMYEEIVLTPRYWDNPDTSRFPLFWRELFRFCNEINIPHLAICIPNVITYLLVFIGLNSLNLDKSRIADALLVYACWPELYLGSFSTIRQALAMGIGLLLFATIQQKKYILSIILYLLAIHIHTSAAILIILLGIYLIRDYLNLKFICIVSIATIVVFFYTTEILKSINVVDMTQYEVYLNMKDNYGSKLIFIQLFLAAYLILTFKYLQKTSSMDRQCYFMTITALIGNAAIYFIGLSSVVSRMLSYFMIFMPIILLYSLNVFKEKKLLKVVAIIVLVTYFCTYLIITQGGSKIASSGFLPYNCILLN